MTAPKKNNNYLNNRDLLKNINISKASYSWYIDGTHKNTDFIDYDIILCDERTYNDSVHKLKLQKINRHLRESNEKRVSALKTEHLKLLTDEDIEEINEKIILFTGDLESNHELMQTVKLAHYNRKLYEEGKKRVKEVEQEVLDQIPKEDLVVRVYTYDHLPELPPESIKKIKTVADEHVKVNFPPYKHYGYYNGEFQCVAMSHHTKDREFCLTHGSINHKLATAFVMMCQKLASRYNWRGYSYAEDMQGQALLQLTMVGLQFNELFSNNPFSYYTTTITNSFTLVFNDEKSVQEIRDEILVENNQDPSWTKQLESDLSRTEHWDNILENNNLDGGDVVKYSETLPTKDIEEDTYGESDDEVDDLRYDV